jgi:hypothetical protein
MRRTQGIHLQVVSLAAARILRSTLSRQEHKTTIGSDGVFLADL